MPSIAARAGARSGDALKFVRKTAECEVRLRDYDPMIHVAAKEAADMIWDPADRMRNHT